MVIFLHNNLLCWPYLYLHTHIGVRKRYSSFMNNFITLIFLTVFSLFIVFNYVTIQNFWKLLNTNFFFFLSRSRYYSSSETLMCARGEIREWSTVVVVVMWECTNWNRWRFFITFRFFLNSVIYFCIPNKLFHFFLLCICVWYKILLCS